MTYHTQPEKILNNIGITDSFEIWKDSHTNKIAPFGCTPLTIEQNEKFMKRAKEFAIFMINPTGMMDGRLFSISNYELSQDFEALEYFIKNKFMPYGAFMNQSGMIVLQGSFPCEKHHLIEIFDDGERFVQYYCADCKKEIWFDMERGCEISHAN